MLWLPKTTPPAERLPSPSSTKRPSKVPKVFWFGSGVETSFPSGVRIVRRRSRGTIFRTFTLPWGWLRITIATLPSASAPFSRAAGSALGTPRTSTVTVTGLRAPVALATVPLSFGLHTTPAAARATAAAAAPSRRLNERPGLEERVMAIGKLAKCKQIIWSRPALRGCRASPEGTRGRS